MQTSILQMLPLSHIEIHVPHFRMAAQVFPQVKSVVRYHCRFDNINSAYSTRYCLLFAGWFGSRQWLVRVLLPGASVHVDGHITSHIDWHVLSCQHYVE